MAYVSERERERERDRRNNYNNLDDISCQAEPA